MLTLLLENYYFPMFASHVLAGRGGDAYYPKPLENKTGEVQGQSRLYGTQGQLRLHRVSG